MKNSFEYLKSLFDYRANFYIVLMTLNFHIFWTFEKCHLVEVCMTFLDKYFEAPLTGWNAQKFFVLLWFSYIVRCHHLQLCILTNICLNFDYLIQKYLWNTGRLNQYHSSKMHFVILRIYDMQMRLIPKWKTLGFKKDMPCEHKKHCNVPLPPTSPLAPLIPDYVNYSFIFFNDSERPHSPLFQKLTP